LHADHVLFAVCVIHQPVGGVLKAFTLGAQPNQPDAYIQTGQQRHDEQRDSHS
jgi:hypothetical protein